MKRSVMVLVLVAVMFVSSLVMAEERIPLDFASNQLYFVLKLNVFVLFVGLCLGTVFSKPSPIMSKVDVNELM